MAGSVGWGIWGYRGAMPHHPAPDIPTTAGPAPDVLRHCQLPLSERERAYSPSSCIGGNYQPFVAAYAERSAQAVAQFGPAWRLGLAYGDAPTQRLDLLCPVPAGSAGAEQVGSEQAGAAASAAAAARPPLLVFIHGGYWQELSRVQSRFAAPGCAAAGVAFAALDYTLAPATSVQHMVLECRRALRWLVAHAAELGFDATRIVLAGSSAGAHLAAMCALRGWAHDHAGDLPAGVPSATVLVSGIYELAPLLGTTINDALGLNTEAVAPISPLRHSSTGFGHSLIAWGAIETEAFKQQSQAFAAHLRGSGQAPQSVQTLEVPARNHFDVILDLANAGTALGAATLALCHA